ncbi:PilZ domain-containing protein [Massilia sp. YIM B02763]|uniref:PilZ domain-containing protein n=1 Tax=Massilia sp. YIM B02763 TaxID=3050130 RepID=UPI0025B65E86|nr:PilZ domain-containing protein [Massilia sp. YIM B02763]MDN4052118.1 PilZ domain-containing protein [Massilia sp. YIM B02763]
MTDFAVAHMRKGPPKPSDAVERITLSTVAHEMRDPFDIGDALSTLATSGDAVTVYLPDDVLAMARIDAVDADGRGFTLELAEHATLPAGRTTLVAAMGGNAKIQFDIDLDQAIVPGEARLASLPLPASCRVLNRRAETRLDSPVGGTHSARFVLLNRVFEMPLYDFSRGGVGLRATPDQAHELYVGKRLQGVELELGPSLVVHADLEVRLLRPFRTFLLGQQVQVGCRISNISMQMRQHLDRAVDRAQRR